MRTSVVMVFLKHLLCLFHNVLVYNILQVIYSEEERKFNKDITVGLIRSELLNLAEYNVHMAKLIDGGRNSMSKECFFYCQYHVLFRLTD